MADMNFATLSSNEKMGSYASPVVFVTATVSLDEAPAMFEQLREPNDHCKVLITP